MTVGGEGRVGKGSRESVEGRTKDDEQALRLASLATAFMNAQGALTSRRIRELYYPHLSEDSFRRTFLRDRARLALCGIALRGDRKAGGETTWVVDRTLSFADGDALTAHEALTIDAACAGLVSDGAFAYRDELARALAKINSSYNTLATRRVGHAGEGVDMRLATLRGCLERGEAAEVTYTDARGCQSERLLALYGSFGLRGNTYFVAVRYDRERGRPAETPKTYRLDRFVRVRACAQERYVVPEDFDIRDFVLLPFQIGATEGHATFACTRPATPEARRALTTHGALSPDGSTWRVDVSDIRDAALWSIDVGLVPLGPPELVEERRRILGEASRHGR